MISDSRGSLKALSLLIVAAVFIACVAAVFTIIIPMAEDARDSDPEAELDIEEVEYLIHTEVNEQRATHGLDRVIFDEDLHEPAAYHSEQMATRDFFAHESPEGDTFRERYEQFGYDCSVEIDENTRSRGGENLAMTYYDQPVETGDGVVEYTSPEALAEGVVDGWMNSPEHRDNILTEHWERQAIAIDVAEDGALYVTQNFC